MPKSLVSRSVIPASVLTGLLSGTYNYPTAMNFNNAGALISITTSSGASINQITGNTGSIVVSPTSGNVVINLDVAGTAGTYNNVFSLSIDDRGRIRSVSTFSNIVTAGTYTSISSISADSYGRVIGITTGTLATTTTNTVLNNCTLSGTSTFYNLFEISYLYDQNNSVIDFNQGIRLWTMSSGALYTPSFINVPLSTGKIVTTSAIYSSGLNGSYMNSATTYLVNGQAATVRWANGQWTPQNLTADTIYTFSFLYDGTTSTIYASFTTFGMLY
jgi:hypothetical protein